MICQSEGCTDHYGCRLRTKGLQVSPRVTPTKSQNWRPSVSVPPPHYKNIIYDERPGGTKMPVLKPDGTVLRHKEYQENKHKFDAMMHRNRSVPTS